MAPTPKTPDPPPGFATFCARLARRSGLTAARLAVPGTTLGELVAHEVGLGTLVAGLQDLNPDAEIPEQVDLPTVTVADLHHLVVTMGPDHRVPAPGESAP